MTSVLDRALGYRIEKPYNRVINGAMMVSQENGSTAVTTDLFYPVDIFQLRSQTSAGVLSAAQVASPSPAGSPNRLRVSVTTADAAIGAGEFAAVGHIIEGPRTVDLRPGSASAKAITIQFGVKAPAGTYCLSVRNSAADRSYVAEYVISAGEANTDVIKRVTLTLDTGGTWLTAAGTCGTRIWWTLCVGTTFQGAAGAWTAANLIGTANQFNFAGTIGNVFELFDVSVTEGAAAPPFVVPDFQSELALCQRYWEKSYPYATAIGTNTQAGAESQVVVSAGNLTTGGVNIRFKTPKAATPTCVSYSTTGASGKLRDLQNAADINATVDHVGENGFRSFGAFTAATTLALSCHWTANARVS